MILSIMPLHLRAVIGLSLGHVILHFSLSACRADPAPVIHYAPVENLEHADVELIDHAEHHIDIAAYVLTDWPVMRALIRRPGEASRSAYIWMEAESANGNPHRSSGN
jgi:phosphatidylserine/phosphatidylglycerophosphate/cardiolipin synthase-like enzyme